MMKLFGYPDRGLAPEKIVIENLAEVTIAASAAELRRIAAFLLKCATNMEQMGAEYGHQHLSDCDDSFQDAPQFVVAKGGLEKL